VEGSGRGLILASARHLHGETIENHENPPNSRSSGRCMILVPPEYSQERGTLFACRRICASAGRIAWML